MITAPALDTPAIAVGGSRSMVMLNESVCPQFSEVLSEMTAGWEWNVPEIVSYIMRL